MNEVRYIDNPSVDEILETEQTVYENDRNRLKNGRSRVVINIILVDTCIKHNHNYTRKPHTFYCS